MSNAATVAEPCRSRSLQLAAHLQLAAGGPLLVHIAEGGGRERARRGSAAVAAWAYW